MKESLYKGNWGTVTFQIYQGDFEEYIYKIFHLTQGKSELNRKEFWEIVDFIGSCTSRNLKGFFSFFSVPSNQKF